MKSSNKYSNVLTAILLATVVGTVSADETNSVVNVKAVAESEVQRRLDSIVIPEIKFTNASLTQIVALLNREAAKNTPDGIWIPIEIDRSSSRPELIVPKDLDDEVLSEIRKLESRVLRLLYSETPDDLDVPKTTLNLREIPLHDTLKLVTDLNGVKFMIRTNRVVIGRLYHPLEARVYRLPRQLFDDLKDNEGKSFTDPPFPLSTPCFGFASNRRLLITINTTENLDQFEKLVSQLDGSVEKYPSGEKLK